MKFLFSLLFLALPLLSNATTLSVEELRFTQAQKQLPVAASRYQSMLKPILLRLSDPPSEQQLNNISHQQGLRLWQQARIDVQSGQLDDRSLYWGRLWLSGQYKQNHSKQAAWLTQVALQGFEQSSRGYTDIKFANDSDIKVLVTGFDPFLLDKDISQSNPSGIAALALDNQNWTNTAKQKVEIQSLIVPVRFKDFDQGLIEALLTPIIKANQVDMILTISMGRDNFDLERFPGLNRSSPVVDNLNILTGANHQQPLPPKLKDKDLQGPQYLEFSLPVAKMLQAEGHYKINDRRIVKTVNGSMIPQSLSQLDNQISVQGSGGGYLSNEISYRTLLQLQNYNSKIVSGHIHTPKMPGHDPKVAADILLQIQKMLVLATN